MTLICLLLIPIGAGLLGLAFERWNPRFTRWISLAAFALNLGILAATWVRHSEGWSTMHQEPWIAEWNHPWIPQAGIRFHLAMDGLSLLLVTMANGFGFLSIAAAWHRVPRQIGLFYFNLLAVVAGIIGVFLAMDLFLFYFMWEATLIPLFLLIGIWGRQERFYAAIKLFLFTQASGLLMLLAILGLYFVHGNATGHYTFDYFDLLHTPMSEATEMGLMLGFFVAFAVKLPTVPVHGWLPDAHVASPVTGSVDLAGLVLKIGAYGLLRFIPPLFPHAAENFAPIAMALGVAGIFYGALMATGQIDLKRLVAYGSIGHMGFVLLGIFSWNNWSLFGSIMIMLAYPLSTGALFLLLGFLRLRIHTWNLVLMGGLWSITPRMGASTLFFALASIGLPGLGTFIGEFLVLAGTFQVSPFFATIAALGMILSTVYTLRMIQYAFQGHSVEPWDIPDFSLREGSLIAVMIVILLWLGLYPQPIFNMTKPAIEFLQRAASMQMMAQ